MIGRSRACQNWAPGAGHAHNCPFALGRWLPKTVALTDWGLHPLPSPSSFLDYGIRAVIRLVTLRSEALSETQLSIHLPPPPFLKM